MLNSPLSRYLFFISICFNTYIANAQEIKDTNIKKNAIFIELAGNAPLYSLNYDRLLFMKEKNTFNLSASIGVGSVGVSGVYSFPMELNFLIAPLSNRLEIGLGYTPSFGNRTYVQSGIVYAKKNFDYDMLARLGYRYQTKYSRIFFRADFTPIIYHNYYDGGKLKVMPWGGISVGLTF